MKHKFDFAVTVLFFLFFGGIGLLSLLLPDRSFSEMENRNLRRFPEVSVERVFSGRFMKEAEDYVSDQTAFRDLWAGLKAQGERSSGKKENNGIYFAYGDTLIRRVDEPDAALVQNNISHLNTFCDTAQVPVYFGLIPSAAAVWKDRLPAGAPTADELALICEIYDKTKGETIDIASALCAHREEEIYFRTDHHWTGLGAFYGANEILSAMDLPLLSREDYPETTVTEEFYGTNYSSASAVWTAPDRICTYVSEEGKQVTSNFTGREEAGRLYVPERLETKNKYACFLGGNQPLCVIRGQAEGPRLLLIRDSYADCLAPFLSERFSEVHLFDLRYNRMDLHAYMEEHSIDTVLILYSAADYMEDKNQFLLSR